MTALCIALAVLAGILLPLQAGVNAALRASLAGPVWATFANFFVGAMAASAALALARQPMPTSERFASTPWWAWTGGLCGATLVFASLFSVGRLGYAGLAACLIAGQLLASVAFDHYGILGAAARELTAARAVGIVLLLCGMALVLRG
ncbi:MAG: DMT family transporter [Phycisphaerae bacterium]|nr:DMT family transporter [Phycisphaerae bacterium]